MEFVRVMEGLGVKRGDIIGDGQGRPIRGITIKHFLRAGEQINRLFGYLKSRSFCREKEIKLEHNVSKLLDKLVSDGRRRIE